MIGPKRFADRWQEEKFGTAKPKPPEPPKPEPEPPPARKRWTADEIEGFLHEIASDPDSGADRMRAIKMLRGEAEAEASELLEQKEIIELMVIEMKALGAKTIQICYKRAFPANKPVEMALPRVDETMISKEALVRINKVNNLTGLYRTYPEIKRAGTPSGFPSGRSIETKKEWCQRMAMKIELDREQAVIGPTDLNTFRAVIEEPGKVDGLESQSDAPRQPESPA
jgi:hypothetical protein